MKIEQIRIEKTRTWNKQKQKKIKNYTTIKKEWKQMKQGKGNTLKKFKIFFFTKMKKPNKE
jgi:hypothetical protein